jgi:4-coumarate--CoA ligase
VYRNEEKMAGKILHGPKKRAALLEMTSLGEFFFNQADRFGSHICQVDANINKSETYSSVKQRSVRLAIALRKRGITSKDVILCCSKNTIDNTIPILAALYLGAKVVNLDSTLGVRNSKHLVSLVCPTIIFVEDSSVGFIESSLEQTNLTPTIIVFGDSDEYEQFSELVRPQEDEEEFRPVKVDIHDTAVMFFSSGTTGLPKAICHSHYSFLQMLTIGQEYGYNYGSTLHFTTFYWISGMAILANTFMDGSARVFCDDVDGETILKIIQDYKLSAIFMAPVYTYKLTRAENLSKYDTSSLRYLLTGGTPISPEQTKRLNNLFENGEIIFGYGMTEVGRISSFYPETNKKLMKIKPSSCGQVAPETSVKIVDPGTEEVLGPNREGAIRVKSPGVMVGYYNLDSSQCFDSDGFLKTGDLGYYDEDKCLYVVGRLREMFKYKSWHIVPSAIEGVILEHPAVKEAVVIGIPREDDGEVPAACVVLKDGCVVTNEEIERFVVERVPDREKLRGGVAFATELPKTPTGKVIREEVQKSFLQLLK